MTTVSNPKSNPPRAATMVLFSSVGVSFRADGVVRDTGREDDDK
jgi:hypothetical protein